MQIKLPVTIAILFVAAPAYATDLTGVWTTPQQVKLLVTHSGSKAKVRMSINTDATGLRTITFSATVLQGKSLQIIGRGAGFPIIHRGRRCSLKSLLLMVTGVVVGQRPGRRFHAKGGMGSEIHCGGKKVRAWNLDLSGVWR